MTSYDYTFTHTTPEQRAEIVSKAADWLEDRGWCHGQMSKLDAEGNFTYCTLGAIREVEDDWMVRVEIEKSLACALGPVAQAGRHYKSPAIAMWNDRHRNGKNVIAKLRAAAEKIKTGEC